MEPYQIFFTLLVIVLICMSIYTAKLALDKKRAEAVMKKYLSEVIDTDELYEEVLDSEVEEV